MLGFHAARHDLDSNVCTGDQPGAKSQAIRACGSLTAPIDTGRACKREVAHAGIESNGVDTACEHRHEPARPHRSHRGVAERGRVRRWPVVGDLRLDRRRLPDEGQHAGARRGPDQDDVEIFLARFCYRGQRRHEWEREYFGVYHPMDERVPRLRQLPDRRLVHVRSLYTEQETKTSPTFNEAMPRAESQNGLNARMDGPNGSRIIWVTADPIDGGEWSSNQIEMIEHLMPHVRQYVSIRQALVDAEALGTSLASLLENTWSGIIHLDRWGRIVAANDRASAMLRRGDGLSDQGGYLQARLPADNARLQRLLARALPPFGGQGDSGSMMVRRLLGLPQLVLHLSPVADRQLDIRARRVAALALVVEPASRTRIDRGLVAEVLGLTPTESEVAVLLAEGNTVRDIARATGRSESTVRWHIKHIFNKHGINRQLELVQLVLSLAAIPEPGR